MIDAIFTLLVVAGAFHGGFVLRGKYAGYPELKAAIKAWFGG